MVDDEGDVHLHAVTSATTTVALPTKKQDLIAEGSVHTGGPHQSNLSLPHINLTEPYLPAQQLVCQTATYLQLPTEIAGISCPDLLLLLLLLCAQRLVLDRCDMTTGFELEPNPHGALNMVHVSKTSDAGGLQGP
jgi:hypothetical protein